MIFPVPGFRGRAFLACAALFGLVSAVLAAPQTAPQSAPQSASQSASQTATSASDTAVVRASGDVPFRAGVSEVIVPVTVTDFQDRFVDDLNQSDFKLFDENVPQTITFFSRDRKQPVVVGCMVDMSDRNVIL